MESSTPATNSSLDGNPPMMMLPDPAVGIIDLATLKEIHHFLNQSSLQDDRELAAWVRQHFLYEPITSVGREIRTTESFSQLDRAYRRARSLTNKTQDKWPFFSRDWKEMPSATVRNNARGEAAPGVALPGMTGAMHDSPISDSQTTHAYNNHHTTTHFVPFGTSKPTRHDPHRARRQKSFAAAVAHTPVPLPPTKQGPRELRSKADILSATSEDPSVGAQMQPEATSTEALSEHPDSGSIEVQTSGDPGCTAEFEAGALKAHSEQPTDMSTKVPATLATDHSLDIGQDPTNDAIFDPDGGKVRGPNGRFMPKENSGRPKRVSKTKPARKSKVTKRRESVVPDGIGFTTPAPANPDHNTMTEALLTPESVKQDKPMIQDDIVDPAATENHDIPLNNVSPALAAEGDINASIETSASKTKSDDLQDDAFPQDMFENNATEMRSALSSSPCSSDPPLGYTLAAESDPVSSNLDKLPPGSRLSKKRKAEAVALEGPRRKRGRPLKAEQPAMQEGKGTVENAANQPSTAPGADVTVTQDSPRMSTRRTTRRSAAAKLEVTAPVGPTPKQSTPEKQAEHDEDKTMVDIDDADASAGHKVSLPVPEPVEAPPARLTRAKAATSDENPSKLNLFALDDEPKEADDSFALGPLKTGSDLKRSEIKKKVRTLSKPTPEPAPTPEPTNGSTKVEFFARVETPKGKIDVPLTANDLQGEVEMMKKYAEWMEKEGMKITYHAFKSIFGLAKKV